MLLLKTYTFKRQLMFTCECAQLSAFVSAKYRNASFTLYGLTVKTGIPYLNILRYIILNILRYCVFIHNISIVCSLPYRFKSRNKSALLNSQVSGLKMTKLYLHPRIGRMNSLYGICSERFTIKLCNISQAPRGRGIPFSRKP